VITAFLAAFGPVFLAELPDKTMFASLVLTTRTRRPLAVWSGVAGAFLVHVILAVAVGSLLRKLPTMPVRLGIAALFIAGGLFMLRSAGAADEDADDTDGPAPQSFVRVAVMAASVVGLAEFGDLTQLTTAGIAARYGQPVAVAAGAWSALLSVAALAVTAGQWIVKRVPLRLIQRIGGVLFVVFGIVTAISAFS
jgi:putative Ca2+/H+ antiporter (TMEM165/GDT1 family)